jgi:hypothetical protein
MVTKSANESFASIEDIKRS